MRTANQVVDEIASIVKPPRGVPIVLTENPGSMPNWTAAAGAMDRALTDKFAEKIAELRKTDPILDWTEAGEPCDECRRVARTAD